MLPFTIFSPHLFSLIPLSTSLFSSFPSPLLHFLPFSSPFSCFFIPFGPSPHPLSPHRLSLPPVFSFSSRCLAVLPCPAPSPGSLDDRCSDTIRLHPILSGIATSEFYFEIFRFVSHSWNYCNWFHSKYLWEVCHSKPTRHNITLFYIQIFKNMPKPWQRQRDLRSVWVHIYP